jgi:hypothetical protein
MGRHIRVLALCITSLLALGAASAGAAGAAPHWTVNGSSFGGTEALNKSVLLEKSGTQTTPAVTITAPHYQQFSCSGAQVVGNIAETSHMRNLTLTYSGCIVLGPNGEASTCRIKAGNPVKNGLMNSTALKGNLVNVEGRNFLILEPESGEGVFFAMNETECGFEGKSNVDGSVAFEVKTGTSGTYLSAESSEAVAKAAHVKLLWGAREVFTQAKVGFALASAKAWGVGL